MHTEWIQGGHDLRGGIRAFVSIGISNPPPYGVKPYQGNPWGYDRYDSAVLRLHRIPEERRAPDVGAALDVNLGSRFVVGTMASLGNAYQYPEWLAAVYMRHGFTPQSGARLFPPRPLTSPYLVNSELRIKVNGEVCPIDSRIGESYYSRARFV